MTAATVDGRELPLDASRGRFGMALLVLNEALLFGTLFFGYFYLGHRQPRWPPELPKLRMPLVMTAVLVASSLVLHEGERLLRRGRAAAARWALWATVALGLAFVALQAGEVRNKLATLTPQKGAYGSIFYTITGFHAAHLVAGLLMLAFVGVLPVLGGRRESPLEPLPNASLYWHFVDAVWIAIVTLLYLLPRLTGGM